MTKKNTFLDFCACAEHLVKSGLTAPDRLAISGASAGGCVRCVSFLTYAMHACMLPGMPIHLRIHPPA